MTDPRRMLGAWGEALALAFLLAKGDRLLFRNYRTPYGELDLITLRGDSLVFIEVKTRNSLAYGPPEMSITPAKQEHLIASALAFLDAHPEFNGDWQIDVIAVRRLPGRPAQVRHIENAVNG